MRKIMSAVVPGILLILMLQMAYGQGGPGEGIGGTGRVAGAQDPVVRRLFLVGDAGALMDGHQPVCDWLRQRVDWNDTTNILIYLGDNIYPGGMPPEGGAGREEAMQILEDEVSVVAGKKAKAFFVPGDHDWRNGRSGGWQQLRNEETYLDSTGMANVELLPKGGCPGPVAVPVGDKMVLVFMDSEWWLQQEDDRPGARSACDCRDEKAIVDGLKDIVSTYPDKLIVLAMHHPFYTHGEYGGYYTLKQHIFPLTDWRSGLYIPLPVIGSIYPLVRGVFGNVQDTRNPRYKDLRQQVGEVIKGHPNIVHVAGHEHTLQLLEQDGVYYIVSGAGSKTTRVKMGDHSLFAREDQGFAVIEQCESGRSTIKFYTVNAKDLDQTAYVTGLPPLPPPVHDTLALARTFPDSVTVTPAPYFLAGGFKRFLMGANYRKEWAAPVRVKVLDLTGWKPLQRGGGTETRSLRLENAAGTQYVLRGVEKYITDAALPQALVGAAFVKDLVTDGVSASYPYAALSIPPLASALKVPHASPQLVFVPDDPRLGKFRSDFANVFCFLEEREPGNGKKTYSTPDMERKLQEDNDNTIDQRKTLQARLLDMFVMDFDRHEDQWRWEADDNGKGETFSPVPRDRDQPFFINQGLIPRFAGSDWVSPQLQGFRPKARNIRTYNYNARNFDHNYLNELTEKDWRELSEAVLAKMTDSLIDYALSLQPAPVHPYALASIVAKLKARRQYYVEEMMTYYRFLAEVVSIYGSDKREWFDIERQGKDSVTVTVYKINKDGEHNKVLYKRVFLAGETREIRLYGRGGDDVFHTHGAGGGGIVVRLIGGPGKDLFFTEAKVPAGKTRIYDLREKGEVRGAEGAGTQGAAEGAVGDTGKGVRRDSVETAFAGAGARRVFLSGDPAVNAVNRLGFKYNVLAPLLDVAYNPDDGVFLGLQFHYTVQGFHKEPYKQLHILSLDHSLATKAYAFKYSFESIHAVGPADLLVHVDIRAPENTVNFFGFGNESVYEKDTRDGVRYYRARYNSYEADMQLRRRLGILSVAAGPALEYFTMDSTDNQGRYIDQTGVNGLNRSELYRDRLYAGGRITAVIDNRNDKIMPSRGIFWQNQFGSYGGLNDASHPYSKLNSSLALYTSFSTKADLVLATRVGWGRTFGQYEFYEAQTLGALEDLRGYRKYRFTGDEEFFHNFDVRVKLAEFQTYLFPGSLGLQFFNDIGRVWQQGQSSEEWHDGYGGGIWISPLRRMVLSACYAEGTDGGMVLLKLGFQY
jgi:hypothetical protein